MFPAPFILQLAGQCRPRPDTRFARLDALSWPSLAFLSQRPSPRAAIILQLAVYSPKLYSFYRSPTKTFSAFWPCIRQSQLLTRLYARFRLDLELPFRFGPLKHPLGYSSPLAHCPRPARHGASFRPHDLDPCLPGRSPVFPVQFAGPAHPDQSHKCRRFRLRQMLRH
ncbi:hypothetical protein N657DRAFT_372309 [Parathielavia appendiculata]|uniref:Uncharacterized protein n=1 Tax=Parathielavia appendiculata TaxID=2587402 RepID=A0AAN6TPU6_9PEZI|nr:hypothetical protein N657DRAFT_372309 [Parathielavia appendiculata]